MLLRGLRVLLHSRVVVVELDRESGMVLSWIVCCAILRDIAIDYDCVPLKMHPFIQSYLDLMLLESTLTTSSLHHTAGDFA